MFKKVFTSIVLTLVGVGGFLWVSLDHSIKIEHKLIINIGIQNTYAEPNGCRTAEECNKTNALINQNAEIKKMMDSIVAALNIVLAFLTILVSPAIMFASWLMTPDWTSGDLFNIRPIIHSLWITISNITYFIYAILLIFIALATIFNSEHYGYKAMLPKLALGIILVPLTWWIVQFVISASSYITASVMTIPAETMNVYNEKYSNGKSSFWNTPIIPRKIIYTNDKSSIDKDICKNDRAKCIAPKEIMDNAGGMYSPLLVYGYGIFSLHNSLDIKTTWDQVKNIIQLIHQWLIGALMFIVFGILVLALVFMLMVRAIKLWFYAIFSPLFTLQFVVWWEMFWENKDSFSIKEFLGLAFVPALVWLSLSFWLVIISALMSATGGDGKWNNTGDCTAAPCRIELMSNPKNYISSLQVKNGNGTTDTTNEIAFWGITYIYKWSVTAAEYTAGAQSVLSSAGGIFWTIIIDIIALVFIWVAFMAAKWVSKTVSAAIAPFENMGKKIGELGMSLPKYAPIPGTGGLSMKSMEKVPNSLQHAMESSESKRFENSSLWRMLHADQHIPAESVKQIKEWINLGTKQGFEKAMKDNQTFTNRPGAHNAWIVEEFMKKIKEKHDYMDTLGLDATMKWYFREYADKDLKNEDTRKTLWWYIQQSAWTAQKWNTDGKAGNNSSWFTIKEALDDKEKNTLILELWWISITTKKDWTGIAQADKDRLKDKVWTWTRSEFEENIRKGGISNSETINKITADLATIAKDSKKFFKPEEK